MERKKGISLIVLVVTIIVMIIIAGAIIISLTNTNIIDMAERIISNTEVDSIKEIVLVSTILTDDGKINKMQTYEKAKFQLIQEGLEVDELQEDGTFVVKGKKAYYELKIQQIGVDISRLENGLDGLQGTYIAISYIDGKSSLEMKIDGKGKAIQTLKEFDNDGTTEDELVVTEMNYEYDKSNNKYIADVDGYTFEVPVYNLVEYSNKVIYSPVEDNRAIVFTTNRLEGLLVEGLEGKTYKSSESELVFVDSDTCTKDDYSEYYYFTVPYYAENNEDKIIIHESIYTLQRDENNNIIKIVSDNTGDVYEYQAN